MAVFVAVSVAISVAISVEISVAMCSSLFLVNYITHKINLILRFENLNHLVVVSLKN